MSAKKKVSILVPKQCIFYFHLCSFLNTRIGLEEVNTYWRFGDGSAYDYDPPDRHFAGSSDHNCTVLQKQTSHWNWVPRREFNDYSCYLNRPFICRSAPIRGKKGRTIAGCNIRTSQLSQRGFYIDTGFILQKAIFLSVNLPGSAPLFMHTSDTLNSNTVNSKFALI